MQAQATASVIPLEAKTSFIKLGDLPLEVIVEAVQYQDGADCVDVVCIYPTNFKKVHQLFLKDKIERLLEFMVLTFKGVFNESVIPLTPLPTMKEIPGAIAKFKRDVVNG
jgi:hypothetical protein